MHPFFNLSRWLWTILLIGQSISAPLWSMESVIPATFNVGYALPDESEWVGYSLQGDLIYLEHRFKMDNQPEVTREGIWKAPTVEEWQILRAIIDSLDGCSWQSSYTKLNQLEGHYRFIEIGYDDCALKSESYNAPFPHDNAILEALEKLLEIQYPH